MSHQPPLSAERCTRIRWHQSCLTELITGCHHGNVSQQQVRAASATELRTSVQARLLLRNTGKHSGPIARAIDPTCITT